MAINKTISTEAASVEYIAPYINQDTDDKLAIIAYKLSMKLQRTLDVKRILSMFCEEACHSMPCNNITYYYQGNDELSLTYGEQQIHHCHYTLELDGEVLGHIECSNATPFSEKELMRLETLLNLLIFPLRNALMYHSAIKRSLQDPLTELHNRAAYNTAIETEIYRASRHSSDLSLLMIDIDHFKQINDQYGHLSGDKVLKYVAQKLKILVRKSDLVYRYGGEEFVILMTNTHLVRARLIAERIRMQIEDTIVAINQDDELSVTVSIGVSGFFGNDDANSFFNRADQGLYLAKEQGRNQVRSI